MELFKQTLGCLARRSAQVLPVILTTLVLVSCGTSQIERAIVGKWISDRSSVTFEFFNDGTFAIEDPNNPVNQHLTGTFRAVGDKQSLDDAQFSLIGGYDIRFTNDGTAFYVYIDNAGSEDILYYRDPSRPINE